MEAKLSGSYYTPKKTVDFMFDYLVSQKKSMHTVLEPSAGDGRFLQKFCSAKQIDRILGIELYSSKTQEIRDNISSDKVNIITSDFLDYSQTSAEQFDLVIGNPPYIRLKNMSKRFLDTARALCKKLELPASLVQNSWVAFVLAATQLTTRNGTIFLVLPNEFLQVQYAENLRSFLEEKFNTIHIVSFSERMFPEIEQEACLVYLTNEVEGLPYILYRQYDKLDSPCPIFESRIERNKPLKKWSNAVLSDNQIDILNRTALRYQKISQLSSCAPGIVTGANSKFILTAKEVDDYSCSKFVKPIISKGTMAKNKFEINTALISDLAQAGKKVYLLALANTKPDDLPLKLRQYLAQVATFKRNDIEIQNSYKCSKRKPWYAVPIVKSGDVVFFKRYDMCPRMSTNPEGIYTTDITYNLRLFDGIDSESLTFCFYNSLTLAQCEFMGRYYAGGVSELTPNEFRTICIPYRAIPRRDIETIKNMFSNGAPLEEIVDFVNSKTLLEDLSAAEIAQLDSIRIRLMGRRKTPLH